VKIALSPAEKVRGIAKFIDVKLHRRPVSVSIEVTKRCNARCNFCDYWKISDRDELTDFAAVVRRFDPLVVVITGGEPMLRRDLAPIVKSIKAVPGFRYVTLLTHGGFLSESRIEEIVAAGVNQINVSMNYPNARQDAERGIPGLFERLQRIIPRMTERGVGVFNLSAMLMLDNMHEAEGLIRLAHDWRVNVAFSGYNDLKNGNGDHFVPKERLSELRQVCRRILELKRQLRNVMTADWFFETLPEFYEKRDIPGCIAGSGMIHVAPNGMVQPCAELPTIGHYTTFDARSYRGPDCGRCWDSCRVEPQAPITLRRIGELTGLW
jgi:MoaA/NifB/PqqE/SkfB family radical SAM enzyme